MVHCVIRREPQPLADGLRDDLLAIEFDDTTLEVRHIYTDKVERRTSVRYVTWHNAEEFYTWAREYAHIWITDTERCLAVDRGL